LENVDSFLELRRREGRSFPRMKINTVIMRSNLGELEGIMRWCLEREITEVLFAHVEPFNTDNDESVLAVAEEYNAVRDRLRALARERGIGLLLPPPILPEYLDPKTGRYLWLHCELSPMGGEEKGAHPSAARLTVEAREPGEPQPAPTPHPYPLGLHCICPWMTLVIDCWGNLYPCNHRRNEPFANVLRQERQEAINSIRILRLRRQILRGRHEEACPQCQPIGPYADPMKRRLTHANLAERELHEQAVGES